MKQTISLLRWYLTWTVLMLAANVGLLLMLIHSHNPVPVLVWLVPPGFFGFVTIAPGTLVRWELRRWNHGICPDNQRPWRHVDTDSQGGRLYCAGSGHTRQSLWVSWLAEEPL